MTLETVLLAFPFYNTWPLKLGFIVLTLLASFVIYITRGLAVRYFKSSLHPYIILPLGFLQIAISIGAAILLPNNYLCDVEFFRSMYDKNGLWIPVSMIVLFAGIFMSIGIFLSLIAAIFFPSKNNEWK